MPEKIISDAPYLESWSRFVANTMHLARHNCIWLSKVDAASVMAGEIPTSHDSPSYRNHLEQACAAWAWIFFGTGDAFQFDWVCDSVGLDPGFCRREMAAACRPTRDINTLVKRFMAGKLRDRDGWVCGWPITHGKGDDDDCRGTHDGSG